jgi:hypothetical protein
VDGGAGSGNVLYFAYGSNMLTRRLRARAPSARRVAVASLGAHSLRFRKRGRDGSAKCDALWTGRPDDRVHGVLFEIADGDWAALDAAEGRGRGYERAAVDVELGDGRRLTAQTYRAQPEYADDTLLPYSWYRDLVAAGARAHGLPKEYVEAIERQRSAPDPSPEREARERQAMECGAPAPLRRSGREE